MAAQRRAGVLASHVVAPGEFGAAYDAEAAAATSTHSPAGVVADGAEVYSVALPERLEGTSGDFDVHRHPRFVAKLLDRFPGLPHVRTLHDASAYTAEAYRDQPQLGWRPKLPDGSWAPGYEWVTYGAAREMTSAIGAGLIEAGVKPGDCVGLYSINCPEWVLVDYACQRHRITSVPLYDTLGPDVVEYISNHAGLTAVACSAAVFPTLLKSLPGCPTVKLVVVYGQQPGSAPPAPPPGTACRVVLLDAVAAAGRANPCDDHPPSPDDIATICYTSGTTGNPKGAMLTHANLIANAAGHGDLGLNKNDRSLSYLPLAHIYERVMAIYGMMHGMSYGFYRGDTLLLMEDVDCLKPTVFLSVPRVLNRVHDKVLQGVNEGSAIGRQLFNMAYAAKKKAQAAGKPTPKIWDSLVFSKLRAKLGGNMRMMSSGSAPLSAEVYEFLKICFIPDGGAFSEGYGMTETACTISKMDPDDNLAGHVGGPIPCMEVKLVDVPEMGYTRADKPYPRGEVCARGPSIFKGYYKDEEKTREMIDEDGWLHTGDIGAWIEGGRLQIIDRKKNIFKLSQGEYVAPEKVENVYARSPFVAASFVHGDSLRSSLVAVVVPDEEVLMAWAKSKGVQGTLAELCVNPAVVAAVLASMNEAGKAAKLRGFEFAKAVHLVSEPFTSDNGLLTPTFKLKRNVARDTFRAEIDAMYESIGEKA